jgi:hypothetical protein
MVEAEWVAERRGLQRFRTEQPPANMHDRRIVATEFDTASAAPWCGQAIST